MELNTKKDFVNLMHNILDPLKDKYTPGGAFLDVGRAYTWYEDTAARMEAFARPLWGLIPFWAGDGRDKEFEKIYLKGLTNGSDPESGEYWGDCRDYDQKFVEMASLAYGLMLVPDKIWEPLSYSAKDNLAEWMYTINDHDMPKNNWTFFRILVNTALKKLGRKYSEERLQSDFEMIEASYLGDGWYSDGVGGQKDYYIPFAMHFYGLIYAKVMENDDPERSQAYKERAKIFAKDFVYWFSDSGAAVPYGRSLTYRFAQIAFWSMCLLADVWPYPVGVIKGIITRNLQYWFENNDIFDNGHVLTVGYRYAQLIMSEQYNAPGSPYWGMKAFAFLALPDEHEFWSAKPAALPPLEDLRKIEKADMLAARYRGSATLYPAGTLSDFGCGQQDSKYLKFAYSSTFGFSTPKSNISLTDTAPDSTLAFELDGRIFTRIRNRGFELLDNKLITNWSSITGIEVETTIIPTDYGHIRKHKIISEYDCIAYDGGFAVANLDAFKCKTEAKEHEAIAENTFSKCAVQSDLGEGIIIEASPNTNLMYSKTKIPAIKYTIKKGENIFKTYVYEA